jgi:hypothetical protein
VPDTLQQPALALGVLLGGVSRVDLPGLAIYDLVCAVCLSYAVGQARRLLESSSWLLVGKTTLLHQHSEMLSRRCKQAPVPGSCTMRMRGLEPPPGYPDTDLNRARLPIPPHPRAEPREDIAPGLEPSGSAADAYRDRWHAVNKARTGRFASLGPEVRRPPSSRGLGRRPLTAVTRVRIPLAVLTKTRAVVRVFALSEPLRREARAAGARRCAPHLAPHAPVSSTTSGMPSANQPRARSMIFACVGRPLRQFKQAR